MDHNEAFLRLVEDSRVRIHEVSVDEVVQKQESGAVFHLVDVREDNEWERSRITGSVHLGKGILERDIEQAIPEKEAEIVLYCGGGYRSALAADALQRMGYPNVHSMAGGYKAWKDAHYPIDS